MRDNLVEATEHYVRVACPGCSTHRVVPNHDYSFRIRSGVPVVRCPNCQELLPLPDRRYELLPPPFEDRRVAA